MVKKWSRVKPWSKEWRVLWRKSLSKDCMWNVAFLCSSIILKFVFVISICYCGLNINISLLHLHPTSYILHIHTLYHIKMNNFCWNQILKIHNFQGQKCVWTKCAQICCKNIFFQFQIFKKQSSMLRSSPILRRNGAHLIRKNDCPFTRFKCFKYAPKKKWFS